MWHKSKDDWVYLVRQHHACGGGELSEQHVSSWNTWIAWEIAPQSKTECVHTFVRSYVCWLCASVWVCVCTVWSLHHFGYTCLLSFNWGVRFLSSVLSIPFDPVSCTLFPYIRSHFTSVLPMYSSINTRRTHTHTHNVVVHENMPRMFVTEYRTELESSNQVEFF